MEFDDVIEKRHSVRSFKSKKPSWKSVLLAVEAAAKGPFSGNHNNIRFVIVEDKENIEKIADYCHQTWIAESSTLIVVCGDETHLENLYGERGRVYSRQQAGAAIENFLLKIADLDLSACWVGSYTDELIRNLLQIPSHMQIEAVIPVGYEEEVRAKPKHPRTKKSIESSIYWEKWQGDKRPSLRDDSKDPLTLAY